MNIKKGFKTFLVIIIFIILIPTVFIYGIFMSGTSFVVLFSINKIPKYPSASLWTIDKSPELGNSSARICLKTTDSQDQVLNYYHNELGKRGWEVRPIEHAYISDWPSGVEKRTYFDEKNFVYENFFMIGSVRKIAQNECDFLISMGKKDIKR